MSADLVSNQYYAVIFTSKRTEIDGGYKEMLEKMVELAKQQPGFLGIESVKEKLGISVSYWKDLASIGTIMLNMLMQGKRKKRLVFGISCSNCKS